MIRLVNGGFELPISEIIEVEGTLVQVVEDDKESYACKKCYFYGKVCKRMGCLKDDRKDGKNVHFEVIEKGGENHDKMS